MIYYRDAVTGTVLSMDRELAQITEEEYRTGLVYVWINDSAQAHEDDPGGQQITREQYEWYHAQRAEGYRPSYAETTLMERIVITPTLAELKAIKLSALNTWNASRIAAGYTDPQGRIWAIGDDDRRAWNELATAIMLSEMEAGDLVPSMREKGGTMVHTGITVAECREILKGIAMTYMQIDAEYAALRAAIVNAGSEAVLEEIPFGN